MRLRYLLPLLVLLSAFAPVHDTYAQRSDFFLSTVQQDVYTAEYRAVLNRAKALGYTLPSEGQKVKQNQIIVDLKAAGKWNEIDVFYVFATDGDSDFATLNWKSPSVRQCSKVNSPTFTTNEGFSGNASTSYVRTNFNVSTQGFKFQTNTASYGLWVISGPSSGTGLTGISGNNNNGLRSMNSQFHRINSTGSLSVVIDFTGLGYKALERLDDTNVKAYVNTTGTSATQTMSAKPNATQLIGIMNSDFSNARISMFYMGGVLGDGGHSAIYTAINTYLSSL